MARKGRNIYKRRDGRWEGRRQYPKGHMEKEDSGYKRIMHRFVLGLVLSGILLLLGTGLLTRGMIKNTQENLQRDYYELTELTAAYEDQKVIQLGSRMLYEDSYQRYYKQDAELYAEIMYDIGLGYRRCDNPIMAAGYMKRAADISEKAEYRSRYYMAWIQQLLEAGNGQEAKNALELAAIYGLKEAETAYIQAELNLYNGKYQEAVTEYCRALEYVSDSELCSSIYRQLGRVYWLLGDYEDSIRMLEQAASCQTQRDILRELAGICMDLATTTINSGAAREYRLRAIDLYEQLNGLSNPAFVDRMNLGILYLLNEQYYDAQSIFETLYVTSEDYKVPMYLAYIAYEQGDGRLEGYYEQALAAYRRSGTPQDENMSQLILLMGE